MKKVVGYIVSIVGIGIMSIGFGMIPVGEGILKIIPLEYLGGIGLAMVGVGVFISLMDKDSKRKGVGGGENEVPIYEGLGKKRRIVGYRKD